MQMKYKSFYMWLMIAAVVFVVVSLGGCGGSSNLADVGTPEEAAVSMSDVWQDQKAAEEIVAKLDSGDLLLMLFVRMETIEKKSDDTVVTKYYNMAESIYQDANNSEVPYNAADVLAHYNSGDVIVLLNTDITLVNSVRADLGLVSEDARNFGESGILEAYAISRQRVNGLRNDFTYIVPNYGDIPSSQDIYAVVTTETPADNSLEDNLISKDTAEDKAEVIPEPYTLRDFQINRWANFLRWMGNMGITSIMNANAASAYTVRAAANADLTSIADAQNYTFDFCYSGLSGSRSMGGYKFTFPRRRDNFVYVTVYAAHSYTSGKDYYLIESTTSTVPKEFSDRFIEFENSKGHYYKRNVLYGFTKDASTEYYIDGNKIKLPRGTSDVSLIRQAPRSVNSETGYTEGMEWGINGSVGASKDGPSAEVGGSVSFSKSKSWTVSEYTLTNACLTTGHPSAAKWYVDVQSPNGGSTNNYVKPFVYWDGVNAVNASRNQLSYDTYFMWEVGKDYWKNNSKIWLNVVYSVTDGYCGGWCTNFYSHLDRSDAGYSWSKEKYIVLDQPSHTGVSRANIALTAHNTDQESFIVYAEDSWTIKDVPSWLHLSETSGSATGGTGRLVIFDVDANTTGSPRTATLKISSGRDNVEVQIAQSRTN